MVKETQYSWRFIGFVLSELHRLVFSTKKKLNRIYSNLFQSNSQSLYPPKTSENQIAGYISHTEFTRTLCPNFSKFIFLSFLKLQYRRHLFGTGLWPYVHFNVQRIGNKGMAINDSNVIVSVKFRSILFDNCGVFLYVKGCCNRCRY